MSVLPAGMDMHHMHDWCPQWSEDSISFLEGQLWTVSYQMVLETEPGTFAEAASALHC